MLILGRDRMKHPERGYAKTFLTQLEECLGLAQDRGVRIVANAGGLNPAGLADAVRALAQRLGVPVRVAHVDGDDLSGRAEELGLGTPLTANAYLGAWGIVDCLNAGADVVVTGRVTDASVTVGPAAAHFGWEPHRLRRAGRRRGRRPRHRMRHPGHRRQLLLLHRNPRPDLRRLPARRDPRRRIVGDHQAPRHRRTGQRRHRHRAAALRDHRRRATPTRTSPPGWTASSCPTTGPDRVRISGVTGEPPPPTLKVSLNSIGGFRNAMTFVLTGLDIDAKADLVRRQLEAGAHASSPPSWSGRWPAPTTPTPTPRKRPARCCAAWSATPTPRTSDASSLRPQSNWRWPAIRGSPSPRRRATVRSTGSTRPATSTPPRWPHAAVHADGTRVEIACATRNSRAAAGRCAVVAGAVGRRADAAAYRSAASPAPAAATRAGRPTSASGSAPTSSGAGWPTR